MDYFTRAFLHVLKWQGGFVSRPTDRTGSTMHGVSRLALERWRGETVSISDLRQLTRAEAEAIYHARYWAPLRCGEMSWAAALVLFDAGVTHGCDQAVRLLQKSLDIKVDAVLGEQTLRTVRRTPCETLVEGFAAERLVYYAALPVFDAVGPAFTRRLFALSREALHPQGLSVCAQEEALA